MADLYVLFRENDDPLFAWRDGRGWRCADRLSKAKGSRSDAVAIIPGQHVLSLAAPLNARSEAEARRMAPFAVEDDIAEPVEAVHVAVGPKGEPGQPRALAVISKSMMQELVGELETIGLPDAALVSADSLLPNGQVVLDAGQQLLVRVNERTFTVDSDLGTDLIAGLVNVDEPLTVYGETTARSLGVAAAGAGCDNDEMLLARLAEWANAQPSLQNLRQGPYGVRRDMDLSGLGQWRTAGLLAAASALGYLALIFGQAYAFERQAGEYRDTARDYVERGWPHLNGNVDAAFREINSGTMLSEGRLDVLGAAATLYLGLEAAPQIKLTSIRYDAARQQFSAIVVLQEFGDGDALVSNMQGHGIKVEIGDARMLSGQLMAELVMRPDR
ncbi:MAG: type II secretion system protein GspL [Pseudomonadota bacterium]